MNETYSHKKFAMEFVREIWESANDDFNKPCVVHLEGRLSDPSCAPFRRHLFVVASHVDQFSDGSDARLIVVAGDHTK